MHPSLLLLISLITVFIYLINFFSIIVTLYFERKKPITAVVWILVLTLIPIFGFILYFIFGRNLRPTQKKIFKHKKEYDDNYTSKLINEKRLMDSRASFFSDKNIEQYQDIIEMNINANRSIYSQDNAITIFTLGKDKYDALLKDIESATDSIHILYYMINNDNIGKKIVDSLTKKAVEGVTVRLLYDHIGSLHTPSRMFNGLKKAGGKVYRFFPLSFGTYFRINYRNHRKIVIIDGKIGYVGGMNIGDEYMGLHKRINPWRDTHLRITGTSVHSLQERFLMDWTYASMKYDLNDSNIEAKLFPTPEITGTIGMQVVSSGPDSKAEQIKRSFIKIINSAKETLFIESPYFIPDEPYLEALQISAMSGVDVRVMLPSIPDKKFVYHATTSYIKDLLDYGVKVYLYPGFLHSKMLIMDGKVCSLGTSNTDIRSFILDFEINAFIYDTNFSQKCFEIFIKDMEGCTLVTPEAYASRGVQLKLKEGLCRLFSPLL
ncbi:MAG: cardiolipin synthase [Clostridiaceae bacterium]|nr:cardiolipin synthase [Clostridiaceae bacterium]